MSQQTKKIVTILIAIILVELLFGFVWLKTTSQKTQQKNIPVAKISPVKMDKDEGESYAGKLALVTDKKEYKIGNLVTMQIVAQAPNISVGGIDTVIFYDPILLKIIDQDNTKTGIQVQTGTAFPSYPRVLVDEDKGRIIITGVQNQAQKITFPNDSTFATLVFEAKAPGTSEVRFQFEKGKTVGSTIVDASDSKNILGDVTNAEITILQ